MTDDTQRDPSTPAPETDGRLVTVAERADELSASILVQILKDAGIKAMATGGFIAGFRAEAPASVEVKTFERDAKRAAEVIAEVKRVDE
ncbi:MAG: DUF2007 domain-containing protein [Planctomycetota bacterium]